MNCPSCNVNLNYCVCFRQYENRVNTPQPVSHSTYRDVRGSTNPWVNAIVSLILLLGMFVFIYAYETGMIG